MVGGHKLSAEAAVVIGRRFPERHREIERLAQTNDVLRSICDDIAIMEQVLERLEEIPESLRSRRRIECQEVILGLTREVEAELDRAKIMHFPNTSRDPET
jgi:hypothetical protein